VQTVHDQDDGSVLLVVETAVEGVVESLLVARRRVCDKASSGFKGSSRMIRSAPRPVSPPPIEVAIRQPWAVVSDSEAACRSGDSRVGKMRRYQWLAMIRRQLRDNLSASSGNAAAIHGSKQ
jgi:hypothetical protein